MFGGRLLAHELSPLITRRVIRALREDFARFAAEDLSRDNDLPRLHRSLEIEMVRDTGSGVSICPARDGGAVVVVPAGVIVRIVALARRLVSYRDAPNMKPPEFARKRHQLRVAPPSGLDVFFGSFSDLPALLSAACRFDAETELVAGEERCAAEVALIAVWFMLYHEIVHAALGHFETRVQMAALAPRTCRMLDIGFEIQADVHAATMSTRFMLKQARAVAAGEIAATDAVMYWTAFSHNMALAVLDPRDNSPHDEAETVHPHPYHRQEFIHRAAVARIIREVQADASGALGADAVTRLASFCRAGLDQCVSRMFWLCSVISSVQSHDLYSAYALRKTIDWQRNDTRFDQACLVLAETAGIARTLGIPVATLNAIPAALESMPTSPAERVPFLVQTLPREIGAAVVAALERSDELLAMGACPMPAPDEQADAMEFVMMDKSNPPRIIRFDDRIA